MSGRTPILDRLLAAALMVGAFVLMASIFGPSLSSADRSAMPAPTDQFQPTDEVSLSEKAQPALMCLGDFIGRDYTVRVYLLGELRLYSVFTPDGGTVGEMLRLDELREIAGDDAGLEGRIGEFVNGRMLMLAEPDAVFQYE